MKLIHLNTEPPFKTRDVLTAVISQPATGQGINAADMRRRCRLLDALEKEEGGTLHLEDADHALLVQLLNAFQFATAHPALLRVIDDVLDAKAPPALTVVAAE